MLVGLDWEALAQVLIWFVTDLFSGVIEEEYLSIVFVHNHDAFCEIIK